MSFVETSKLFDDKADIYAASRPAYPEELFDFISSLVESHGEAWDCATGNGQAAIGLARRFSTVQATDISTEQIANAFEADNINFSVQPGEATNFRDNQFDLVSVAQALHWFDYEIFWDEVSRVLKPDGAFVAFSYVWPQINETLDEILEECIRKVVEPYWAPNNKLVWDSYRALDLPFETLAAPGICLENHWNFPQFINYVHSWSGTRRCMDDIGMDFFEDAQVALSGQWGDASQQYVVRHPLVIIAGAAW